MTLERGWENRGWYNEADSPKSYSSNNIRFPQQADQTLGMTNVPASIDQSSMTAYWPVYYGESDFYQSTDEFGNVTQTLKAVTYESKVPTNLGWIDAMPYNMPFMIAQGLTKWLYWDSFNRAIYDLNTGYALSQTAFRSHTLYIHDYWSPMFVGITGNSHQVVSEYNQTSAVNLTSYMSQMYPANGTVSYNGATSHAVAGTETQANLPMIFMVTLMASCFVVLAIFFLSQHYKHHRGNNEEESQSYAAVNDED